MLAAWDRWEGRLDLAERICHGDPKLANLRFDEAGDVIWVSGDEVLTEFVP